MKADLFNNLAEAIGQLEIPERIFGQEWNPDLVHQAVVSQEKNSRQNLAHVKGRGEVSGGGRKPWKQKHTGRSRQGSIRSPIWIGGGVAHGPTKERVFSVKINKKMKQVALFSVLSRRFKDGEIRFVDTLAIAEPKTKNIVEILKHFFTRQPDALIIPGSDNKNIYRVTDNLPKVKALDPQALNVRDLLVYKQILIERDALPIIDGTYRHA
jgi:large subunit ribosomal protein L4